MKGNRLLLYFGMLIILAGCYLAGSSLFKLYSSGHDREQALKHVKEGFTQHSIEVGETMPSMDPSLYSFTMGEYIGILEIPRLKAELPIIEGTSEEELEIGVGHFSATALPGQRDQILLSGHRDTVFRQLGELDIGDRFTVVMAYGTFTYEIAHTQIVDANDTSIIKSTAPIETLVISTCYPFSYIGSAPDRYVLTAYLVRNE